MGERQGHFHQPSRVGAQLVQATPESRGRSGGGSTHFLVEDSQITSDTYSAFEYPLPFRGAVITTSNIRDKSKLLRKARELGAETSLDLTDRVNFLVTDSHGGMKYAMCVEKKIPILISSWIEECYKVWKRGDDVDFASSVANHRLPIFSGVVVCLSGHTEIKTRTNIHKIVVQNGGEYVKNIERPCRVTHLLCQGDDDTHKMIYAEKFNAKKEAAIHLVWDEWFWDSLEFGGRFEESNYHVRGARPEPKSTKKFPTPPPDSSPLSSPVRGPQHRRSPHKLACVPDCQRAKLSVTGRAESSTARPEDTSRAAKPSNVEASGSRRRPTHHGHLSNSVKAPKHANSFLNEQPEASEVSPRPSPRKRTQDALFGGVQFCLLGEASCDPVRYAIESAGGTVTTATESAVDYVIVRLLSGSDLYRREQSPDLLEKFRTECWLERCLHERRLCDQHSHASFLPLSIDLPVEGADKVYLSFSGLSEADIYSTKRLLKALGINFEPNFSRRSTHLLCPSAKGPKYEKALEWKIPIIDMEWLMQMRATASVPQTHGSTKSVVDPPRQISNRLDLKGEGKAPADESGVTGEMLNGVSRCASNAHAKARDSPERPARPVTSFGSPNELLPSRSSRPPSSHDRIHPVPFPSNTSTASQFTASKSPLVQDPPIQTDVRPQTQAEIEAEKQSVHIPSSRSPSPMESARPPVQRPVSPMKVATVSAQATKQLQDSIATLLGKRKSESSEGSYVRNGKRQRPQRSRSRQTSFTAGPADDDIPQAPEEYNMIDLDPDAAIQETGRVVYRDPREQEEKRRLMKLAGILDSDKPPSSKNPRKKGGVRS